LSPLKDDHPIFEVVRLVPTTTELSTTDFGRLFMREIFHHYGFPLKIVSDSGSQWNSAFFRAICEAAGVQLSLSASFHLQTNGLTERTTEVVAAALRQHVNADMKDWHLQLPLVEFAMNSAYHDAIHSTPFRMNRVSLPVNPFDALNGLSAGIHGMRRLACYKP
jgi:transposase InsO family protein